MDQKRAEVHRSGGDRQVAPVEASCGQHRDRHGGDWILQQLKLFLTRTLHKYVGRVRMRVGVHVGVRGCVGACVRVCVCVCVCAAGRGGRGTNVCTFKRNGEMGGGGEKPKAGNRDG